MKIYFSGWTAVTVGSSAQTSKQLICVFVSDWKGGRGWWRRSDENERLCPQLSSSLFGLSGHVFEQQHWLAYFAQYGPFQNTAQ